MNTIRVEKNVGERKENALNLLNYVQMDYLRQEKYMEVHQ